MEEIEKINTEISLGWLSCTVPHDALRGFCELVEDNPVKLEVGFRGYEHSAMILGTGRIGWSTSRPEAHIDLSAGALSLIEDGDIGAILAVIDWVFSVDGHFTRLDVSFDNRTGIVTVKEVEQALVSGDAVSYWRKWNNFNGSQIGLPAGAEGETVYIGSKKSRAFLRVYNKALEQNLEDTHWTRFELQIKDELATGIASVLLASWKDNGEKAFAEQALSLLRGFIEFKDKESDINPTRRAPLDWWTKLTEGADKVRITRVKTERSIEKTRQWLESQIAPSLGLIHDADGGSFSWLNKITFAG